MTRKRTYAEVLSDHTYTKLSKSARATPSTGSDKTHDPKQVQV